MHGAAESGRGSAPDWQAPAAVGPVRFRLRPPGSKSVTNRALVLAALAGGPTVITNPLRARDTLLMAAALRALGSGIEDTSAEAGSGGGAAARRGRPGRPVGGGWGGRAPRPAPGGPARRGGPAPGPQRRRRGGPGGRPP